MSAEVSAKAALPLPFENRLEPHCLRAVYRANPSSRALGATGASAAKGLAIEALQEVLKKLKTKSIPIYEKKYGQVPMCHAGERCAVRKGARIGKLCDCPRGTTCNSFLLKCL
uniref:Cocaine- and amphetamine-regulated transcript protein n=1 Tax=Felis catus TaxID=9685 RepID=A0ABI7YUG2_FELCA